MYKTRYFIFNFYQNSIFQLRVGNGYFISLEGKYPSKKEILTPKYGSGWKKFNLNPNRTTINVIEVSKDDLESYFSCNMNAVFYNRPTLMLNNPKSP